MKANKHSIIFVNIINISGVEWFSRQLNKEQFSGKIQFFENSKEDRIWDLVVVYEGLPASASFKHKKGGLLFISGEPPLINLYPRAFTNQFDYVLTSHTKIKHRNILISQQSLTWHFGFNSENKQFNCDFEDLVNLAIPEKSMNISVIASSKSAVPGHSKRLKFINQLKEKFNDKIDFYGRDTNPIKDKANALLPYRFHICIENSEISDYWTEKISDSILGYSVPIYFGCTNISDYFPFDCLVSLSLDKPKFAIKAIEKILKNPEEIYFSKLAGLTQARKKLLYEYNIYPVLNKLLNEKIHLSDEVISSELHTQKSYLSNQFLKNILRIKRRYYKFNKVLQYKAE